MSLMSGQLQSRSWCTGAGCDAVIQTGATVMGQLFSVELQLAQVRVSALPDIRAGEAALVKRHVRYGDIRCFVRDFAGELAGDSASVFWSVLSATSTELDPAERSIDRNTEAAEL